MKSLKTKQIIKALGLIFSIACFSFAFFMTNNQVVSAEEDDDYEEDYCDHYYEYYDNEGDYHYGECTNCGDYLSEKHNYNILIDYQSIFYRGNLLLPDFIMSETGRIHFVEVKRIFEVITLWRVPDSLDLAFVLTLGKTDAKVKKTMGDFYQV